MELFFKALIIAGFIVIVGYCMVLYKRLQELRAAEYIIENQFNKADKKAIQSGFTYFEGDQLQRYRILITRIRSECGHEGVKVGHLAWVMSIMEDPSVDVTSIDILTFSGDK